MTKKRIHLVYSIVLGVALVVAGICLVTACVGIYQSGAKPFTPEAVATAFSGIAIPVYLCLALVVGGFILDGFFPADKKKLPAEKQYAVILARLQDKLDIASCDSAISQQIRQQQKSRMLHKIISLALLVIGSLIFLRYGANSRNFDQQDITGSIINAMYLFLPCLAIPFGYGVFAAYHRRSSLQKEIALVKQALADGASAPAGSMSAKKDCGKALAVARWALLGIAIVIMVYGFFAGGTNDVLTKAINICTECVGLG